MEAADIVIVIVGTAILLFISMLTCAAIGRATGERKGFALLGFFWVFGIIIAEATAKGKFVSPKKVKKNEFVYPSAFAFCRRRRFFRTIRQKQKKCNVFFGF